MSCLPHGGSAVGAAQAQAPGATARGPPPRWRCVSARVHGLLPCRVLGLLGDAERLYRALEDEPGASHCRYLRALLHDGLGQAAERDADAAAFGALLLATPE